MNLEQTYRNLQSVLPYLKLRATEYKNKEQDYYYSFSGVDEFRYAFNVVNQYAPFLIEDVYYDRLKVALDDNTYYSFQTQKAEGDNVKYALSAIPANVEKYLNFIRTTVFTNSGPNAITVKFVHIHNLEDLEKTIGQLKIALNVPVYELDGRIELNKIDSGSLIFELIIEAASVAPILLTIGKLIQSALKTKKLYQDTQIAAEQLKKVINENSILETIKKQIEENYEKSKEIDAQAIIEQQQLPNNPNSLNNIKNSIQAFNEMIDKGAEFYPSLQAPIDVQQSFPDHKEMKQLEEGRKLLTEAKPNEADQNNPKD